MDERKMAVRRSLRKSVMELLPFGKRKHFLVRLLSPVFLANGGTSFKKT
jgi:hypothetical protein